MAIKSKMLGHWITDTTILHTTIVISDYSIINGNNNNGFTYGSMTCQIC